MYDTLYHRRERCNQWNMVVHFVVVVIKHEEEGALYYKSATWHICVVRVRYIPYVSRRSVRMFSFSTGRR